MRSNRQMRRWISAALCLLLTFSVLAGTLPTARAEAVSANTKEVVLNSMDSAADWHAESSDSVAISAEAAASGDRTALRVTGTYKQKASAFANLIWNAGGLNLTGADIVIHYDPWWNVAVENQATDRAHRIGQKNVVTVYKLITKGTIEEKIIKLQQMKKELAEEVLSGDEIKTASFQRDELLELLEERF